MVPGQEPQPVTTEQLAQIAHTGLPGAHQPENGDVH